jgi:hypothetical protein
MGEMKNAYTIFGGKPKRKRPFEKLRQRWNDNIKMDLK